VVVSPMYNPATPLPGGIKAGLVDTPVDDELGSGCFRQQWEGIDGQGKLALVKRGLCAVADKLRLAKEHGALGENRARILSGRDSADSWFMSRGCSV
jgi:hypothetical protein